MKNTLLISFIGLFLCALIAPVTSDAVDYRLRPYFKGSGYAYAYPILQWEPRIDYSPPKVFEFGKRPLSVPHRPQRSSASPTRVVYIHTLPPSYAQAPSGYYPTPPEQKSDQPTVIERERVIVERAPEEKPPKDTPREEVDKEEEQVSRDFDYKNKTFIEHLDDGNKAFKNRNYEIAKREFKHAAGMQPSNATVRMGYALGLFATGDYETAAMVLRRALQLNEDWIKKPVEISTYYGKLEDYNAHLSMLERYIKKHPQNLEAKFLAGYIHFMNGDLTKASETMAKILEDDPNDSEATAILGYLTSKQLTE